MSLQGRRSYGHACMLGSCRLGKDLARRILQFPCAVSQQFSDQQEGA